MSKFLRIKKMRLIVLSLLVCSIVIILGGCDEFRSDESFYKFRASGEELHAIDTLKLQPQEVNESNIPVLRKRDSEPNVYNLSLEQCRAFTLENNLDLKVQLIEPQIAGQELSAEEAKFEAAFFADASHTKLDTPTATTLEGSNVENTTVNAGVEKPLKTGGVARLNLLDSKTNTNNVFSTLNPQYEADASFSIIQPLLRNAGKKFNTYSIRIAAYELDIAKSQTKLEIIRVLSVADRVYWRLYAARRALEVRKQEYELALAQLKQVRRFVEIGETAEVEIIRSEAGVASKVEAIIISENMLRDRERELKQVMNVPGMGPMSRTEIIPVTEPQPLRFELERNGLVEKAISNRMEMLEMELALAIAAENVDFFKNQALPLVDFDYTYKINGLGPTRSDAYDMLWDNRFEDHRLGMRVLVPLGNEAAQSRVRRAIFEKKQRLATKDLRELTIENEVLGAADQLEAAWQKILASRENAIMAGRLWEAEKRQFEIGLQTSTDVLNAQTQFADAQRAEIEAVVDYEISRVDLAFATGTVLGASKVRW